MFCLKQQISPGYAGPSSIKRHDILLPNLVNSRSREIACYDERIALKFDRHLGSAAAEVPVKFQSDYENLNLNLVDSRLHEILWLRRRPA